MAPSPEWILEDRLAGTGRRRVVGHGREQLAQDEPAEAEESYEPALHAPRRWGLSAAAAPTWATGSPSAGGAFVAV